ncbi:hypothetical protein SDC9_148635 [bioreactor metagenome]|uniref:Uncharacterized protein n=1 Tax=bioreactor metagenome TaxID=1076179 RepID=A0A645EJ05_9ZZZZ
MRGERLDLSAVSRHLKLDGGVAQLIRRLCNGHDYGQIAGKDVVAVVGILLDDNLTVFNGYVRCIGHLTDAKMLRDFGANLSGIAVDRLLAAEDNVEFFSADFFKVTDGRSQGVAGGEGIGAAESPVADQIRRIGADGERFFEHRHCLRQTHGNNRYLTAFFILEPQCGLKGECVKRIEDARDTAAHERVGHRINFDLSGVGNLFYTYQNVHN